MDQPNRRNYYRILHVQRDAPLEVIKSSYRTLMQRLKMHPDLGGDHWNATLINEAYQVLTDPEKRAAYDRTLPELRRGDTATAGAGPAEHTGQAGEPDHARPQADPGTRHRSERPGPDNAAYVHRCPFCQTGHSGRTDADSLCRVCSSPLARVESPQARAAWLRAVERMPQNVQLRYWTRWPDESPLNGKVVDLSLTGVRFATPNPVAVNQILKLDCPRFQAVARVIHSRQHGERWLVGAEFFTLKFARTRGAFVSEKA
ncbi:MAG TPA: hypothetical protein ENK16_02990 [Chromatiales bacterium]|nr:hypothetical protein [Chromatiales bacterium]